ncbi:hypothetical protein FLJC2902T_32010 [Flavobacterium limnosediminis JC2902]|uniref:Uncharacterized protein n=1 Tax=Flavobacterium limnosediminis JC2902 TaxID=1341181 RepID=V6SD86_9FLAO|nr:hypothetical protein FLJC2902T_32010 [Flavobacterium limnosediminis JC2902]
MFIKSVFTAFFRALPLTSRRLCGRWGFLLLMFTNIPKSLKEKISKKEGSANTDLYR